MVVNLCTLFKFLKDSKLSFDYTGCMKTGSILALMFFASSLLVLAQGSDEENAVLQTERELCTAYLKGDADAIAQGVMEDYTLTNSTGKITTRADDIKKAHHKNWQLLFLPVSESKKFIEQLGCGVAPTSFGGSSQHHIIIFPEGHLRALPVHFRSRGQQHLDAVKACRLEDGFCFPEVGLDRAHGRVQHQLDADRRRQVIN